MTHGAPGGAVLALDIGGTKLAAGLVEPADGTITRTTLVFPSAVRTGTSTTRPPAPVAVKARPCWAKRRARSGLTGIPSTWPLARTMLAE